ncbi:MAG: nitrite/sulfite reductase [Chloroflexi bacterium]|nr:nitrite/sulfite reductase [Chloroflexota bacterium]
MAIFQPRDGPREVKEKVAQLSAQGQADLLLADGEPAIGKLRLAGLYDDRQEGYFMMRVRIPGGRLSWRQADVIGQVAQEFARRPDSEHQAPERFLELTTRQDVQVHWMRLEYMAEVWRRFDQAGITTLQACGDTARNITGCPVAGIDPYEALDVYPLVSQLTRLVLDDPEYGAFLPRKFKAGITGCRDDCILARINDLAFSPARSGGATGFNVWIGGGLSDYPRLASDIGLFVTPEQVLPAFQAVILVFKEFGDYDNKAVNRFRGLVEKMGPSVVRAEMQKRAPYPFQTAGEPFAEVARHDHIGVHPQKQPGLSYVGLAVPVGRMQGEELREAARLARDSGDGDLRLTPRQDLVLSGVSESNLSSLLSTPLLERYSPDPLPFSRAVVACTSAPFCKFGIYNMKEQGVEMARTLDEALGREPIGPIRLHMSGCKASCAQIQIADIGLRASLARDEEGYREAFDVAVGGDLAEGRLARWLALEVPAAQVRRGVQGLVATYRSQHTAEETFGHFLLRTDPAQVRQYFQPGGAA